LSPSGSFCFALVGANSYWQLSMVARIRLVFLGVLACNAISAIRAQEPKSGDAALIEAENDVTARKGAGTWEKAVPTFPLAVGDRVKTGKKSRAAVRLTDLSVIRLDQLSLFEVGAATGQAGKSSIDLKQGGAY